MMKIMNKQGFRDQMQNKPTPLTSKMMTPDSPGKFLKSVANNLITSATYFKGFFTNTYPFEQPEAFFAFSFFGGGGGGIRTLG